MDPQQRMVLECVHMAMEDGGITRDQLDGTHTGVYIGKTAVVILIDIIGLIIGRNLSYL